MAHFFDPRAKSAAGAELIGLPDLDQSEIAAWSDLAARAVEPNPFFEPDFVLPAARGLGEWEDVSIIVLREDGEWVACMPVRLYPRWHSLPLTVVATWAHSYCFLGTPLVDAATPRGIRAGLCGGLARALRKALPRAPALLGRPGPAGRPNVHRRRRGTDHRLP